MTTTFTSNKGLVFEFTTKEGRLTWFQKETTPAIVLQSSDKIFK